MLREKVMRKKKGNRAGKRNGKRTKERERQEKKRKELLRCLIFCANQREFLLCSEKCETSEIHRFFTAQHFSYHEITGFDLSIIYIRCIPCQLLLWWIYPSNSSFFCEFLLLLVHPKDPTHVSLF